MLIVKHFDNFLVKSVDKVQWRNQSFYRIPLSFRRILKCGPPMPKDFSPEVRDFILRLLTKEPHRRLGAGGAEEVATY